MSRPGRQRIAILGAGMGSMATAFALTCQPGWRERYDVTVYQQGWLIGGKGASVRNRQDHYRIEEHGLHIWMGFYENAFRMIRDCYAELSRKPGTPLATWTDAFKKHDFVVLEERLGDQWLHWRMHYPRNSAVPGSGDKLPAPLDYVGMTLQALVTFLVEWDRVEHDTYRGRAAEIAELITSLKWVNRTWRLMTATWTLSVGMASRQGLNVAVVPDNLQTLLQRLWRDIEGRLETDHAARRLWFAVDFIVANIVGIVREGLLSPDDDFTRIDHYEYREWLAKHGASRLTIESAPVKSLYGLLFSEREGTGAGTMLNGMLRMVLTYKGAIFYKMQAGMGETVFTPMYEVLSRRGVKFRFFHQVKRLALSGNGREIESIEIARQATIRGGGEYQPLIDVDGLGCWPEGPLYEQLVEADAMRAAEARDGLPIDAHGSRWQPVEMLELRAGIDFDDVVLGIPIGALGPICAELAQTDPRWARMLADIKTIPTQAMQLWCKRDLGELGWKMPSPVVGTFAEPFDTWADMTHLLQLERWTAAHGIRSLAYLCGAFGTSADPVDAAPDAQARANARVREQAERWLRDHAAHLFCESVRDGGFDFSVIHDGQSDACEEREETGHLNGHYFRANVNPWDRYVLSVPGSTASRLAAHDSGFSNLVLAGDWVRTGLDAGCIESAVMSGLQASRALTGFPKTVVGEPARLAREVQPRTRPSHPEYVERPGDLALRAPYGIEQVKLFAYGLDADRGRLEVLCDRYLNRPARGQVRYAPAAGAVFLVCALAERISSHDPLHVQHGSMAEVDIGFWVPLVGSRRIRGVWVPDRLVWMQPYLFVDSAPAVTAGREVYGFPKMFASIEHTTGECGLLRSLRVVTDVVPRLGPQARVQREPLLALVSEAGEASGVWETSHAAVDGITSNLFKAPIERGWANRATLVFLKQFRDAARSDRACYQAIIEAPAVVQRYRGGGRIRAQTRVRLGRFESHPIARELGLRDAESAPFFSFWLDFDFVMQPGHEIWRA